MAILLLLLCRSLRFSLRFQPAVPQVQLPLPHTLCHTYPLLMYAFLVSFPLLLWMSFLKCHLLILESVEGFGLFARAICHETDHLDGILYPDVAEEPEEISQWKR